ncbi:MAG TPA: lycopene cyclase family protein [Flavobacterium sp.]|jgi:lycopene beta-cyclase|nr:lycopene cyclase family protein [Flavobacterium sp.]HPJ09767.1 lycopene cyclase family protein [Flavobacterium sp.]
MDQPVYDYIFSGFGLAAYLSLDAMLEIGCLEGKQILIIDSPEPPEEKTWSYWERGKGLYDVLLLASWKKGWFVSPHQQTECLRSELIYKSISSVALRNYLVEKIRKHDNISITFENVVDFSDDGNHISLTTNRNRYQSKKLFNSIPKTTLDFGDTPVLLQHFEGWVIQSPQLSFAQDEMVLMDFTVPQRHATRFMYVLPFSQTQALFEYTLFSPSLIDKNQYEQGIRDYLSSKNITEYTIEKTESGVIPMTVYPFWKANTKNILHIGTAGGWTKPATGYTFLNALPLAAKLANDIKNQNSDFTRFFKTNRFLWYDRLLIEVLYRDNASGQQLFTQLFTKANPANVLRFLQQQTHFWQELPILLACPKVPFIKAALRSLRPYKK